MKIERIMTKDLATCAREDSLARAAQLMWDHDCGCVLVVDNDGHLAGIVTDRDVAMAAYTQGRRLEELPVTVAMSTHVVRCRAKDPIAHAESLMQEHRIRRLPVIDDNNRVVGIVSLNDVAIAAARGNGKARAGVPLDEVARTLATICEHRPVAAVAE